MKLFKSCMFVFLLSKVLYNSVVQSAAKCPYVIGESKRWYFVQSHLVSFVTESIDDHLFNKWKLSI